MLFEHGFLLVIHVLKRSHLHDITLHGEGCGPDLLFGQCVCSQNNANGYDVVTTI